MEDAAIQELLKNNPTVNVIYENGNIVASNDYISRYDFANKQAYTAANPEYDWSEEVDSIGEVNSKVSYRETLTIQIGNEIIAGVTISVMTNFSEVPIAIQLTGLFVDQKYQNNKIAANLLTKAIERSQISYKGSPIFLEASGTNLSYVQRAFIVAVNQADLNVTPEKYGKMLQPKLIFIKDDPKQPDMYLDIQSLNKHSLLIAQATLPQVSISIEQLSSILEYLNIDIAELGEDNNFLITYDVDNLERILKSINAEEYNIETFAIRMVATL